MGCSVSIDSVEAKYMNDLMSIYKSSKNLQDVKSKMLVFLNKFYNTYKKEAAHYYNERINYNIHMMELGNKMMEYMKEIFTNNNIKAELVMTSSLNANINIMNESDIDISVIIDNLNESKINFITDLLLDYGYKYIKLVNPLQKNNNYYLYLMTIDGVTYELKIRNKVDSGIILQLHEHMENNMSLKSKMTITYGKLIFRNILKKARNVDEKNAYKIFKKLVYEMYFADIEGGFMFDLI